MFMRKARQASINDVKRSLPVQVEVQIEELQKHQED